MIRPPHHEAYHRHHLSPRTRIPNANRPSSGAVSRTRPIADSAPSTADPGIATRVINWLTGATPGYQRAAKAGTLNTDTLQRIEDLRTALQAHSLRHGKLQLMVKDRLDIPSNMTAQEQEQQASKLIKSGKTEFFLNLEEARNLPDNIRKKYCNPDDDSASFVLNEGIGFMIPTKALPSNFQPNNKEAIKSWLGLDNNVDFQLWANHRNLPS